MPEARFTRAALQQLRAQRGWRALKLQAAVCEHAGPFEIRLQHGQNGPRATASRQLDQAQLVGRGAREERANTVLLLHDHSAAIKAVHLESWFSHERLRLEVRTHAGINIAIENHFQYDSVDRVEA